QVPNMRQDPVLVGRVRELQQQIEKLQTAQREFRQEQAFQLHLYKAERSSKFHFMSPVPSPLRKTIFKEMENSAGNLVTTQNGISDVLVDYYSDLLSTRPEDDDFARTSPDGKGLAMGHTHLTDRSLLEVVRKLSKTLRGYKPPAAISAALDKLDFIIKNFSTDSICDLHDALHPEDWDLLTDVDFSDNEEASDEDNLLDEDDRLVDRL
ncbi:hypothetical protein As57867_014990, partial [Aphanomyces stellatus]